MKEKSLFSGPSHVGAHEAIWRYVLNEATNSDHEAQKRFGSPEKRTPRLARAPVCGLPVSAAPPRCPRLFWLAALRRSACLRRCPPPLVATTPSGRLAGPCLRCAAEDAC
jgi:hypothetical protein